MYCRSVGTYRTLNSDPLACPYCGHESQYEIQFKYGFCDCDVVRLGAEIQWHRDLRYCYGRPVGGRVQVDGCPLQACPRCDREPEVLVTIEDDRVVAVELLREPPDLGPEGVLQLGGQHPVAVLDALRGKNRFVECPHCRWKSDTCTDASEPGHVYCERCGAGISRSSWRRFNE